jgi:type I restriction enzyme, S subunit
MTQPQELWSSNLPPHWRTLRLKWTIRDVHNGTWGSEPDGENDIPCVRVADFDRERLRVSGTVPTLRAVDPSERRGRILQRGDLLLEKSGGGESQPVGTVVIYDADVPAVCSNFIARLTAAPGYDSRYLNYLHAALYATKVTFRSIKQTTGIQNLDSYSYLCERVPSPPIEEQRTIANFLDRETVDIDSLLGKQNRLVSSLMDKRQAVICQFVTRGLNPTARLTPSGVEWLGEVPKHWEVRRIASLFREASDVGEVGLPILSVSIHDGVSDRQLDDEELERKFIRIEDSSKYKKVIPSDLVYNMMRAWQGGFGAVVVSGLVSPAYVVARPRRLMVTKFIELLLRTPAAIEEMRCHSYGVADFRLRLYWDHFKTLRVALPPLPEQREIVEAAQRETDSIDALVKMIEVQNEKLAEYRSALISAAVTGQIDVRNYRPREAVALCQ